MNRLSKEDFYKLGIVSVIFLIIVGIFVLTIFTSKEEKEPEKNDFEIVSNYNIFFFVNNNINHYITYTIDRNGEAILAFLDSDFKQEKNITSSNVFSVFPTYHEGDVYKANLTKAYTLNDNVEVYYSEGQIVNEGYEETTIVQSMVRYLLYVDFKNMIASLSILDFPLDEEKFKNESNGNKEILKNSYNKVEQIEVIDYTRICSMYLSDFIFKVYDNVNEAYSLVTNFPSLEEFQSYINTHQLLGDIASCNQTMNEEGKRAYKIKDKNNYNYTFVEESILNYKVSLVK